MTLLVTFNFYLIISVILLSYYLWCRRKFYILSWKLKAKDGWGYPFIGILMKAHKQDDILKYIEEVQIKNTDTVRIPHGIVWFGPFPFYYVSHPEYVKKILLSSNFINKVDYYDIFTKHFGHGIISSKTPIWNFHRKKLDPAFHMKILKTFLPVFNKEVDKLCDKLRTYVGNGEFDIMGMIQLCALDVTCQTTMGKCMSFQEDRNSDIVQSYYNISKATIVRVFNPLLHNDVIFHLTNIGKLCIKSKKILKSFVTKLIEDKLEQAENDDGDNGNLLDDNIKSTTFIDKTVELLKTNEFTWTDAISESNIMVFASYETSANTISYTLMCLAMFPEYQDKLFNELLQLYPDKDNFTVTYEDIQKLNYTEMVINENLRLMSPVPLVGRKATNNFQIDNNIILPKGTEIVIDIFSMHRDSNIWGKNAKTFYPDHFSSENFNKIHPYAFVPFTKGSRMCIGARYAMLSIKTMLAKLIRRYRFTTNFHFDDLHFIANVTMKLKKVPLLEVHERPF